MVSALKRIGAGTLLLACGLAGGPATSPVGQHAEVAAARAEVLALIKRVGSNDNREAVERLNPTQRDADERARLLRQWALVNGQSVTHVTPGPLTDLPWGYCTHGLKPVGKSTDSLVYLHVFDWHASGKLVAYGLANDVTRAYFLADKQKPLKVEKVGRWAWIEVGKKAPDPVDTVVVLEVEGNPKAAPLAVDPTPEGPIVLHARDAIVHGQTLRYEPEPHKNTVGYWSNPSDWVRWEFNVTKPGTYGVEILQGCGKGSGGSTVDFSIGEQKVSVTVQDTGHFQNFVPRDIGKLKFEKPGTYTLSVKPTKKAGAAVMDLRQVTLKPVG
jgi:hypothetical protein